MESTNTLQVILDAISSVFTALLGHIATIGNTIIETPLLLFSFVLAITVSLIFMAKRFFRR